jgi:hypothetical protein
VDVFPPPGPDRRTSFFAETVPATAASGRLYVGLAAPGRSQKVLLMRTYVVLLAAAKRAFDADPTAADPYMTLVGYFNSLRELGGSQRIVEDEVRQQLMRTRMRHRVGEVSATLAPRKIDYECVELTSRRSTDEVKEAKARLSEAFEGPGEKKKKHAPVDVALASNMISVGVDIQRLGLMVVCGQPKTTAEYIQATSRVGRDDKRPGLCVALLNVHKPRDRSHYEHFSTFHQSFYRGVEATSVTPFSSRAIDRGLAGVVLALARLGDERLTAADDAEAITTARGGLGFVGGSGPPSRACSTAGSAWPGTIRRRTASRTRGSRRARRRSARSCTCPSTPIWRARTSTSGGSWRTGRCGTSRGRSTST